VEGSCFEKDETTMTDLLSDERGRPLCSPSHMAPEKRTLFKEKLFRSHDALQPNQLGSQGMCGFGFPPPIAPGPLFILLKIVAIKVTKATMPFGPVI